jgi:hypothetical protein
LILWDINTHVDELCNTPILAFNNAYCEHLKRLTRRILAIDVNLRGFTPDQRPCFLRRRD